MTLLPKKSFFFHDMKVLKLEETLSSECSWVNPSKRGRMDGVFQGLAGLLRGISRRRSPRAKPEGNQNFIIGLKDTAILLNG